MGQKSIAIVVVWILIGCALSLTISTDESQAAQVTDILGKDLKWSLPGGQAVHNIYVMVGDNITLTFWNYTGPEGRATTMYYASSDYYERSDNFITNLYTEFNIVTGRTYVFWAIVPITGSMSITFDMYNDNTPLSVEYRITRTVSDYTPDYYIRPVVDEMTEDLRSNVSDLQSATNDLYNNITRALADDIDDIRGYIDDLNESLRSTSNEMSTLWLNISRIDGTISSIQADLAALHAKSAVLDETLRALNASVTGILEYIEDLGLGEVELPWLEERLSAIDASLANIHDEINDIWLQMGPPANYDDEIAAINTSLQGLDQQLSQLRGNLTELRDSIPATYDDSTLKTRISQLEGQNELLQKQLDDLEDEQDEMRTPGPSTAIGYVALVIGLIAMIIGVAAFMKRKAEKEGPWEEMK